MIRLVAALTLAAAGLVALPAPAAQAAPAPIVLSAYKIQSSGTTSDSGATISTPGYAASGWYPADSRSTVLAALLKNGVYPDPFFSTNMKNIPASNFTVPWWYRSDFTLGSEPGLHTFLDVSGLISGGDVFVNGTSVKTGISGSYVRNVLDVTAQVHSGVNSVAFKINPNNPNAQLTMGWIDWVQTPPDKNMGLLRDIVVRRSGAVSLSGAHVVTSLNGALDSASLTVKVDARNDSSSSVTTTVSGSVGSQPFSQDVALSAGQTKTVSFPLTITNPQVWWPYGMGAQPLYDVTVSASVGGTVSDTTSHKIGIRSVTSSLDGSGHRLYRVNGRPLLVRGGGYSPDLFLRWDAQYVRDKLDYVKNMGLNTIRLEGHLDNDDLYDMADQMGILVMAGWECCDKWEGQANGSEPGDTWSSGDYTIATASMKAEAERLRDHPSVFTFLIGSDFAPTAMQETNYLGAINGADFTVPIVAAASDNATPTLGDSGMKMDGPYDWIPPNYWYNKQLGGAFGFASEVSAGPDIPTLDSVKRMFTTSEQNTLWQNLSATQYHRSPSSTFNNLNLFNNALVGRYGTPGSLDDYVRKAQLAQYENVRAQFESFGRNFKDSSNPATGVIYWMLNSGWSSLHWQLFDTYLDQGGAYWGTKEATKPLHVQYSYDNKSVVVVNSTHSTASATVKTDVYNLDGTNKYTNTSTVSVPADGGRTTAVTIPSISGLNTTYLVRLTLSDGSGEIDRNVYWLSTAADTLNYGGSDWYFTPTTSYANLKGLASMAQTSVQVTATGGAGTASVTLRNTGSIPALYLDTHVVDAAGKPVLPALWSDNAVSLWPGESKTITATFRGSAPAVKVTGWNSATQTVNFGGGGPDTQAPSVPANVHVTGTTSASISLAWDASSDNVGVAGYKVYEGTTVVATPSGTSATISGLAPSSTHTYTVTALDAAPNESGQSAPVTGTTQAGGGTTTEVQSENATISQGVVESNHTGFTGTGFVNYDNVTGSYVEYQVNAATAGPATVTLRYSNGTTTNRPMDIAVNGTVISSGLAFNSTTNWDTWADKAITANLNAGSNTIRMTATTANGGPNADRITIAAQQPTADYQAEDATLSQAAAATNHTGYTGTAFVDYTNVTGSYVEFSVNAAAAGPATVTLRYSNGTTTNRPMDIVVNGTVVSSALAFGATTNWDTWATKSVTVNLVAGLNTIRATATTANGGPNLDKITLG
ncbi:carbohydrate-binding protein [Streptosporangiaceae bacterium NEAU-GS5]|nr:carbohydrate-binding protein [Streptosporangiaceae bacterium NEAU-GS5]